jgi:hypothetical protein
MATRKAGNTRPGRESSKAYDHSDATRLGAVRRLRPEGGTRRDAGSLLTSSILAPTTAPVDYPDCAGSVATALSEGRADRGIVVCGSGAGASIAANKFPGIRAAVCHDTYTAHQAVEHDDMNVLCLGARRGDRLPLIS